MNSINSFINFVISRQAEIFNLFIQHIQLTIFAILMAVLIAVPLGILIVRYRNLSGPVIGFTNLVQSIPSLALLGFLIPIIGIGSKPAIIMVVMYSLLPILKNTFTGLTNINPSLIEAADGMGLTNTQVLLKVRFPLAMPIIMSGIRISSVTAVGLMTIAAFVGAGGLGSLVFTGVSTVNNNMILAGALPACFLAIFLDFIIGKVETIVIPEGIKISQGTKTLKTNTIFDSKRFKIATSALVLIIILSSVFTSFFTSKDTIVVGSKNYSEQLILGNMVASLIESNTDYKVERKMNLGGSIVTLNAIKSGAIDIYVEYTGVALVNIMKKDSISDPDKVYNIVKDGFKKDYNVEWLKPLGFNNTYELALKQDLAKKYNLNTISDLAKVSKDFDLGCTMEFASRMDGYLGLQKLYNLEFKNVKGIDGGLRYTALQNNETQVTDAFTTDGLLQRFDLKLLKDDKKLFPPYYAVPIVREEILKKYPEIRPVLLSLEGKVTAKDMQKLNYRVDNGEDPRTVAEEFLKSKKLMD
ncbi:ABC transporter permease subunit [Clostridium sp. CM028]|uniref:ABC transporter permease/substrate-binding protein n=1 Tax=Clostridium sp. CM028 TaxID=2851575 RepID=UPI001C6E974F|nr:glycine betaine ABC transporter substrate-binding protein [Clostridium sp. CM028]MBW9149283.1 ABC transporter permease subunit [Clostridium sp. CM028]WLC61124.1 ABC transporter permease subunit [Clostridium sp. CM028]